MRAFMPSPPVRPGAFLTRANLAEYEVEMSLLPMAGESSHNPNDWINILCRTLPMIADIKVPDSNIVRQAEELARSVSNDTLFNHVMRCYWFGELFAQQEGKKVDSELMFLSSVLHDLGLTDHV